jgi:hypothetical protein
MNASATTAAIPSNTAAATIANAARNNLSSSMRGIDPVALIVPSGFWLVLRTRTANYALTIHVVPAM